MGKFTYQLNFRHGHLFAEINHQNWLIDTGSPATFGNSDSVTIGDQEFLAASDYMGLTAAELSKSVKTEMQGLIGTDVLNQFDWIFDIANGKVVVSTDALEVDGDSLPIQTVMGVPMIKVEICDRTHHMFFDTGAQVSYLQSDDRESFPDAGMIEDFYPGFGEFESTTHHIPAKIGNLEFTLRCGRLPELLGLTLMAAGTTGIVGNEVMTNREVGYFPRRKLIKFINGKQEG